MPKAGWIGFALAAALLGVSVSQGLFNDAVRAEPAWTLACLAGGLFLVYSPRWRRARAAVKALVFDSPARLYYSALFLVGVGLYTGVCWHVFSGLPRLDDEVSALFQTRLFNRGRCTLPTPEHGMFFWLHCMIDARYNLGHICSMYPPGWSALLIPGVVLGVPWITNPLLGGALVVTTAALARQVYGRRTGRLAGLFALFSPFLAVLAGTHLSHVPTALFLCLCAWAVCRLLRTRRSRYGLLAGAAWGGAFLCRPLTALVVGAVIALAPLTMWRRALRCWKGIFAAAVLALLAAGTLAAYQHVTTGHFATAGHTIGLGRRAKFGFVKVDWARTHTPRLGAYYSALRLKALNDKVLGWPVPAFLAALLPFFLFRARKEDVWLLLPSLALLATYSAFWYYEEYFPARYVFSGVPMLVVLAARGFTCLEHRLRAAHPSGRLRHLPAGLLTGFVVFQVLLFYPRYLHGFPSNHGDVEEVLPRVLRDYGITNAVVFMDAVGEMQGDGDTMNDFYATGFMRNDLDLRNDVIFARNLKEQNHELAAHYAGRRYYLYRYVRPLNKAQLFRIEFEGAGQNLFPVEIVTPDLVPVP